MATRPGRAKSATTLDNPITTVQSNVVARAHALRARVQPRLAALYAYLADLVERHGSKRPRALCDYQVDALGKLQTRFLDEFALEADEAERPGKVTLRYQCVGTAEASALPPSTTEYSRLMGFLADHHLVYRGGTSAGLSKVTAKPIVPVEFVFELDEKTRGIAVRIRNLNSLGIGAYRLDPEALDHECMQSLERLILRQSDDFFALVKADAAPI